MSEIAFTAFLPTLIPLSAGIDDLLETLSQLKDLSFPSPYLGRWTAVDFEILECREDQQPEENNREFYKLWSASPRRLWDSGYVLKIQTTLEFRDDEAISEFRSSNPKSKESDDDVVEITKDFLAFELEEIIYDLVIIANIARPGTLRTHEGYIFQSEKLSRPIREVLDTLYGSLEIAEKIGWPTVHDLPVRLVWDWSNANRLLKGDGQTPLSRSYNAFTYLFDIGNTDHHIFWALIGIEALYANGTIKVMEQIIEKCQIFLGPLRTHKKSFKQMYNTRSKFIHGALPFAGKFGGGGDTRFDSYSSDVSDATDFAQAILLSTLQQLAIKGWNELKFSFELVVPPGAND